MIGFIFGRQVQQTMPIRNGAFGDFSYVAVAVAMWQNICVATRIGPCENKFLSGIINPCIGDRHYVHRRKTTFVRTTLQLLVVIEKRTEGKSLVTLPLSVMV